MEIIESSQVLASLPPQQRILLAAHKLFYRDGIRATGVDRVIAESGVAKKTFYRHFPSKSDLIEAFLVYRHERWMAWFRDALRRHGGGVAALVPALREWLADPGFRGCAFINSLGELGPVAPRVTAMTRTHKQDVIALIADFLPASADRSLDAEAIAMAVDGAIVRTQYEQTADGAITALDWFVRRLENAKGSAN
ncbi:MAG: TetR/AcrR family transcriptional regulator [Chromatiaceae bacterium]|jgi:AcrR family transcriptional regulator